jgi:TRAP-type C4-dicarboxylate transport system permease small subunit
LGPVPGDFELVEALTAFAVFAFLPWCQLKRGHATVDVFTRLLPPRANRLIDLACEVLMTMVVALIAWRLWHGMLDKMRYHETSFILQFPLWWAFAAAWVAAAAGVAVSACAVWLRLRDLFMPEDAS